VRRKRVHPFRVPLYATSSSYFEQYECLQDAQFSSPIIPRLQGWDEHLTRLLGSPPTFFVRENFMRCLQSIIETHVHLPHFKCLTCAYLAPFGRGRIDRTGTRNPRMPYFSRVKQGDQGSLRVVPLFGKSSISLDSLIVDICHDALFITKSSVG
jgi:hypothetical protein